jgi:amidohydrolase
MPHLARDPILCAAHLITELQTIVSRVINPIEPAVVSVTSINGGDAFNVIPDRVQLKCCNRTFSGEVHHIIRAEIDRICEHVGKSMAMRIEVKSGFDLVCPPTVNHPHETDIAVRVMQSIAGVEAVDAAQPPVMGSEDFAFILDKVPGCYGFIGNGSCAPLHHPEYDFNDGAIAYGVAYWANLARAILPTDPALEPKRD